MITFAQVPAGRCFLTRLNNVCKKDSETQLTRLFNQEGEPCIWFRPASPDEEVAAILPEGTNF